MRTVLRSLISGEDICVGGLVENELMEPICNCGYFDAALGPCPRVEEVCNSYFKYGTDQSRLNIFHSQEWECFDFYSFKENISLFNQQCGEYKRDCSMRLTTHSILEC